MSGPISISAAVEGIVDEVVVRKLVAHAGGSISAVYGKQGKPALRSKINGYNRAARYAAWVVLVDLDDEVACAPLMRDIWVPNPAPDLCFRIAVREVEAWLMADAQTLARYLAVKQGGIPKDPEQLPRPKDAMVTLARTSRRKNIYRDMVPGARSGRRVGPAYSSRMTEYVERYWRPDVAAERAGSLRGAIHCIRRLVQAHPENVHV